MVRNRRLDRDQIENDRYLVLLACGHWTHTRIPQAGAWPCPVMEPRWLNDGLQLAALTADGEPAVLASWDIYKAPDEIEVPPPLHAPQAAQGFPSDPDGRMAG